MFTDNYLDIKILRALRGLDTVRDTVEKHVPTEPLPNHVWDNPRLRALRHLDDIEAALREVVNNIADEYTTLFPPKKSKGFQDRLQKLAEDLVDNESASLNPTTNTREN